MGMENSRMKFKQRIVPIHEDASPVDFEYGTTIGPQDSVDLLQSPMGSDEFTPNLAVIQELEEIRHMIELKSRDLSQQEAILTQSIDRFHFDQVRTMTALKEKAEELLGHSVELMERRFEKGALKINNLLEKVDKRVKDLGDIERSIAIVRSRAADVPPLPDENTNPDSIDDFALKLIAPRRVSRPPIERQFAYALFSLIFGTRQRTDSRNQCLLIIIEYLIEGVDSLFNHRFVSMVDNTTTDAPLVESRFDKAKRGVVVKRLGLGETRRSAIEISVPSVDPPIKFDPELYLDDARVRNEYNDAISRNAKTSIGQTCLVSALIDSGTASLLRQSISQQRASPHDDIHLESVLIRVLVSSAKDVGDNLRPLCARNLVEKSILVGTDFHRVLKVIVFVLDRLGSSLNEPTASQLVLILDNLISTGTSRGFFAQLLNWKQGICWMIQFVSRIDLSESEHSVAFNILNLLDKVPTVDEIIHPFRDSLLNTLQGINISDKGATRIKMLLKLNSYS